MNDELFKGWLGRVREGRAILQGDIAPSQTFVMKAPEVKRIRAEYRLTQKNRG